MQRNVGICYNAPKPKKANVAMVINYTSIGR